MKRILIFAANSALILFLFLFIKSNQVYAACTVGSCISTSLCIAANGLQPGSGTCTSGFICCQAAFTPTPVPPNCTGVCTSSSTCASPIGGICSGGLECCSGVVTASPTFQPTATTAPPTIAPTATRAPTSTPIVPTATPQPTCPPGVIICNGTPVPWPTCGAGTSCHNPASCGSSAQGATCDSNGSVCCTPPTPTPTPAGTVCGNITCSTTQTCASVIVDSSGNLIGTCVDNNCNNGQLWCDPNTETCSLLGFCQPIATATPTPTSTACSSSNPNGSCLPPDECVSGQCVAPTFAPNPSPTPTGGLCGIPPNTFTCAGGTECLNGACVTPTPLPPLTATPTISGGLCGIPPNTFSCPAGQQCLNSACVTPTPNPSPTPTGGLCGIPPNTFTCAGGTECLNGACVTPTPQPTIAADTCVTGSSCVSNSLCIAVNGLEPAAGQCNGQDAGLICCAPLPTAAPSCASEGHTCYDESTQFCSGAGIAGTCPSDGTGNIVGCCDGSVTNIPTGSPVGQVCDAVDSPQGTCYAGLTCPLGTQGRNDPGGVCGTSASCCAILPTETPIPTATITTVPNATDTLIPTTGPGTPTITNTPVPTQVPVVSFTPEVQEGSAICTAPGTAIHVTVASQNGGGTNYVFTASLPNNDGTVTGAVDGGFQTLTLPDASNPDAVFYETNSQITINFTVTLSGATVYTGSTTINNTCQQTLIGTPTDTPVVSPSLTPTGTLTPTVTPTATPTTSPLISTQLNLTVHLHDIGDAGDNVSSLSSLSNKNPVDKSITVTVGAFGDATTSNNTFSANGTLFFNGNNYTTTNPATGQAASIVFSPQLPSGAYTFKIISPKYLTKQIPNIITINGPGAYTLPDVSLTAGDVNLDNQLTINDYTTILSCINNKSSCDTTIHSRADTNDDGIVDAIDENLFLRELSVQAGQ